MAVIPRLGGYSASATLLLTSRAGVLPRIFSLHGCSWIRELQRNSQSCVTLTLSTSPVATTLVICLPTVFPSNILSSEFCVSFESYRHAIECCACLWYGMASLSLGQSTAFCAVQHLDQQISHLFIKDDKK